MLLPSAFRSERLPLLLQIRTLFMTATLVIPDAERLSLEEYFEREWNAGVRHEYIGGQSIPMTYAMEDHRPIALNSATQMKMHTQAKSFRIYAGGCMTYAPAHGEVYYSDIAVVKGKLEYVDYQSRMKATTNSVALVEVLYETTEVRHRRHKWRCYRKMPWLRRYCLVYQEPSARYYVRQENSAQWLFPRAAGLRALPPLLGFDVLLREIHAPGGRETNCSEAETPPAT